MRKSLSPPQIHQKYIYIWKHSHRKLIGNWQNSCTTRAARKIFMWLGYIYMNFKIILPSFFSSPLWSQRMCSLSHVPKLHLVLTQFSTLSLSFFPEKSHLKPLHFLLSQSKLLFFSLKMCSLSWAKRFSDKVVDPGTTLWEPLLWLWSLDGYLLFLFLYWLSLVPTYLIDFISVGPGWNSEGMSAGWGMGVLTQASTVGTGQKLGIQFNITAIFLNGWGVIKHWWGGIREGNKFLFSRNLISNKGNIWHSTDNTTRENVCMCVCVCVCAHA